MTEGQLDPDDEATVTDGAGDRPRLVEPDARTNPIAAGKSNRAVGSPGTELEFAL